MKVIHLQIWIEDDKRSCAADFNTRRRDSAIVGQMSPDERQLVADITNMVQANVDYYNRLKANLTPAVPE